MTTKGILLKTAIALCLVVTECAAGGLNRWAIVATEEIRASGLADLVLIEAGKLSRMELVERDELERVANEFELDSLAGAAGVSQRLKAGRLLRADALVVLKSVAASESNRLRVVMIDSRRGARLATFETAIAKPSLERTAQSVAAEMERVRSHFADGVRLVIGVTPFISRNLEHQHDHWQSRYAELLSNSLAGQPGVAVIEVEEARALLRELSLTSDDSVSRRVPFIVSGQFRMQPRAGATEPDVELSLALTTAKSEQKLPARTIELSRVPRWLVGDFARELLGRTGETFEPLAADVQRAALIRQADSFSQLGDWKKSVGLREAALVLDSDSAEQRVRLIQDYQVCFIRDFERLWSYKKVVGEERAPLLDQAADQFISAQEHLEFLIRNRRISRDEALMLFRRQKWEGVGALVNRLPGNNADEVMRFERVLDAEQRFVMDTFLAILELPESPLMPGIIQPRRHEFPEPCWMSLLGRVGYHVRCRRFNAHGLKFLAHALTRMVPEDLPYCHPLYMLAHEGRSLNNDEQKVEWQKCLTELAQAEQTVARFFGQAQLWELSRQRVGNLANADKAALHALVRDADTILREFDGRRPKDDDGVDVLQASRNHIQRYLDGTPHSNSPPDPPIRASLGRLRFQPLQWTVSSGREAKKADVPLFENMCRCGDTLDVYWTKKSLFFMNRPGELRTLPLQGHPDWSRHGAFSHVTWDGECVWLVVAGRGIFVLNRNGDIVTQFTKETPKPGIEAGLQMLPLAPRRMLVVGSFGEHHRAWCGILEVSDKNQPTVRVFHEATRVADNRPPAEADADITTAFRPVWIHRFDGRVDRPMAFVGRDRWSLPLAIDLNSLAVSLVAFHPRGFPASDAFFRKNGHFVQLTTTRVFDYTQGDSGALDEGQTLIPITYPWSQMLIVGDRAYISGDVWWSIRTDTRQVERLLPDKTVLPNPYRGLRLGVSAHFGLIGYRQYVPPKEIGSPTIFQITIANEAESPKDR